jgi:sigma-B regulation protein RsbU (phosphoserine phosphatase)
VGIIIADVTGHGLPAALVMANMQAAVRVSLPANMTLPEIATRLNALVCQNTGTDVFITAIVGRIDLETGAIEFVSAGHPGPLLLHANGTEVIEPENSLPFGIDEEDTYQAHRIEPNESLRAVLFYTDGLVEAENAEGQLSGEEPVLRAMRAIGDPTPRNVIQAAIDAVHAHTGVTRLADDMTLLALGFKR